MLAQLSKEIPLMEVTMIHLYSKRVTIIVPVDKQLAGTISTERNQIINSFARRLFTDKKPKTVLKMFLICSGT